MVSSLGVPISHLVNSYTVFLNIYLPTGFLNWFVLNQELQATMYESTISQMQSELDKRLDEVTASKDEDAEVIR